MATFSQLIAALPTIILLTIATCPISKAILNEHYYDQICPQAEQIILQTIRNASFYDPKVPARILRMFFHDCFVRVRDIRHSLVSENCSILVFSSVS